jgi:type II secretory pathway component PulF
VIAAGVLWVGSLYRAPASRLAIDRALLRVPVLGKVLRDVAVARFTRTLYTLVSAGLPALTALKSTKATLGNRAMEHVVEEVCDQVASGKTIAEPMERSGYFPPLLTQIVGVGERSGRLPQMLGQAAGVFEDRTETSIKTFTTVFPPLLIIIAAIVIGFIVAAIMLPLIQAQELLG